MDPIVRTIHDTIVIYRIDSVFVRTDGSMDLLGKVDEFYDHAWIKLMYFVTALGAVAGILVPYFVNTSLQKSFKRETATLEAKIDQTSGILKEDIIRRITNQQIEMEEKIENKFGEEKIANRNELESIRAAAAGGSIFVQSKTFMDKGAFGMAFVGFIKAARHLVQGRDTNNLKKAIGNILSCVRQLSKESVDKTEYTRKWRVDIGRLIETIEETKEYTYLLLQIESIVLAMEDIPDTELERTAKTK